MEKCLYCYKPLKPGQVDYHPACARKHGFGSFRCQITGIVGEGKARLIFRQQAYVLVVEINLSLFHGILKLLPLQGDRFAPVITQGDALG